MLKTVNTGNAPACGKQAPRYDSGTFHRCSVSDFIPLLTEGLIPEGHTLSGHAKGYINCIQSATPGQRLNPAGASFSILVPCPESLRCASFMTTQLCVRLIHQLNNRQGEHHDAAGATSDITRHRRGYRRLNQHGRHFSIHPLSRADGGRKQTIISTEQVVLSKRFFSNISFQSRRHKTRGRAHDFRDRE